MRGRRIAITLAAAAAFVATDDGWAARTGGSSGRSAGARAGPRVGGTGSPAMRSSAMPRFSRPIPVATPAAPYPYRFHGRTVIFIGAPYTYWAWPYGYYYLPPPYYYGPDYVAREEMPPVYVERFEGQPTPETQGDIFCPGENAYYPDVQSCASGWQRILREQDETPEDAYAG